jgi:hypothetical protein
MFINKCLSTLFIFVISCLLGAAAWAQTTLEDVVYLKNGSILRGQVLQHDPNTNIKVKIKGGSILVYESSEVLKIEKEEITTEPTDIKVIPLEPTVDTAEGAGEDIIIETWEQHVPEPGFYGMVAVGNVFPGPNTNLVPFPGFYIDGMVGYRIHHLFAIGVGAGSLLDFSQSFLYGYGNIHGDILNKTFSPYYNIGVGYGQPLSRNSIGFANSGVQEVTEMRGGIYFRPSIGMRFASRNRIHTFVDIGLYYQKVSYAGRTWNNFSYVEEYTYLRPSIRVGMQF